MSWKEFIETLKSITLGDIIGALCIFGSLYIGLLWVLVAQ